MSLFDELTEEGEMGMKGKHYINIMIKKNEIIIDLEYDERKKIKKNTRGYMFNDDDTEKNIYSKQKQKKSITNPQLIKIVGVIIQRFNTAVVLTSNNPIIY